MLLTNSLIKVEINDDSGSEPADVCPMVLSELGLPSFKIVSL